MATTVDTVPVPLATKVDRTPSVPLAMIVVLFTNVRGIACFQIFTPRNPALGARKSAVKELNKFEKMPYVGLLGELQAKLLKAENTLHSLSH